MIRFEDALNILRPNTEWVCSGANLAGLIFIDKSITKPTQSEIDKTILDLQTKNDTAKAALLDRLGITADEAKLLLS